MTSKRMNIATPRKGKDSKTYWTNIGTAWFNDNGGIQLVFDALPLPDAEGRCVANLFEPRERTVDHGPKGGERRDTPADEDDFVAF
jgi:hypothetical protein